MKRIKLMTPGPSPVPPFVLQSLAKEIIHHRTDEFRSILAEVHSGLKEVFCTANPVLVLASSGTGGMEAAVNNLFSKGDKVLVICGGKFGERWAQIAKKYSLGVVEMPIEWGTAPSVKEIDKILEKEPQIKGILTTLCETSTATVYDIKSIAELARKKNILSVVDAISGLGQDMLLTDEWGVDVVVSGSQKGFMLPPGLAFISLSQKAVKSMEGSDLPKFYFDLSKSLASYEKNDTPFTPAVSLIIGLREALRCIKAEGIQNRWKRFEKMGTATRQAAKALGLGLFSSSPSSSVTAIALPEDIKSTDVVKTLRKEYGLSIAGGQAQVKEKIIRIAHMGWINEQDLLCCFSLLEKVLKDLNYDFKLGVSVSRLEEVFYGQ